MANRIPSYQLYGEQTPDAAEFWLHGETIPERTHLHNWEIAPHRHDAFFQIFLVTSGRGEILGPHPHVFAAPCAVFVPPGTVHGFRYSHDVDGLVLTALGDRLGSLSAGDRSIALFASAIRIVALPEDDPDGRFAADCITRIHGELGRRGPGRTVLLEALMISALVAVVRAEGAAPAGEEAVGARDRMRIEELLDLIGAHYRQHRPASFYAERLGLSPAHLNRICRQETGASLQQLVAARLVEAARRDLVFTPTPVQKIAYALGFSDPAYFNRFFRRQTGTTPGLYRERERQRLAV